MTIDRARHRTMIEAERQKNEEAKADVVGRGKG
jgi:hypothetical protein